MHFSAGASRDRPLFAAQSHFDSCLKTVFLVESHELKWTRQKEERRTNAGHALEHARMAAAAATAGEERKR